jgi:hypothetical protein
MWVNKLDGSKINNIKLLRAFPHIIYPPPAIEGFEKKWYGPVGNACGGCLQIKLLQFLRLVIGSAFFLLQRIEYFAGTAGIPPGFGVRRSRLGPARRGQAALLYFLSFCYLKFFLQNMGRSYTWGPI